MAFTKTQVSELYVTLMGRASEGTGNQWWQDNFDDQTQAAEAMLNSDAVKAYFGDSITADADFIANIYKNTLNKTADGADGTTEDAAGIAYWIGRLDGTTGEQLTRAEMIVKLIEVASASTTPAGTQFSNRVAVSDHAADTLTDAPEGYKTSLAFNNSGTEGLVVTDDATTTTAADALIDGMVEVVGQSFTLTTGTDTGAEFLGDADANTYTAPILTLTDGDYLDGGEGNDTLDATLNTNIGSNVTVSNIENIKLNALGSRTVDMKNFSGVTDITSNGSTGAITLNNIADAEASLSFAGTSTNNITANYVAGALGGTSDTLTVNLNAASSVNVDVDAGFENLTLHSTGTSDVDALTVPGIATLVLEGSGKIDFANTVLDGTKTLSATDYTGDITTGTVSTTTGFVDADIVGTTTGSTILLGAGNDNIGFTNAGSAAANSNTITLGAGNDKLVLNNATAGDTFVFGEAGDDTVKISTTAVAAADLFNLGAGNDTVVADITGSTLTLKGVENLNLTAKAGAANSQTIGSSDQALKVTADVDNTAVTLIDLVAGSTVKLQTGTNAATTTAGNVSVAFKNSEATNTIDIESGYTGTLTIDKIVDATINIGAASTATNNAITTTSLTTDLTINATGAFTTGTGNIVSTDNKMKNITLTGDKAVTVDDMTSTGLETVKATTTGGALDVGTTSTGTKLTSVEYTSSDTLAMGNIGSTTGTNTLAVTVKAEKAITGTAAIESTKLGDIDVSSTAGAVTLGAIGSTATEIGDITIAGKSDVNVGLIGHTTEVATSVGTTSITSTNGAILLADINVKDADGISVDLNAKTNITDENGAGSALKVENVGGNITATLAGDAKAEVEYIATTAGIVTLTASNTGGLVSTITNAGTAGDGSTSAITLGNAATGKVNDLTIKGTADTVNITGGTGTDNISFDATNAIKGGTIALGGGTDSVDFTNFNGIVTTIADHGVAINLSSATHTFSDTNSTTVSAGTVVEYNSADAASNVVSGGNTLTLSGVETVIGSDKNDFIAVSNTGMTVTGGAGTDAIKLNAGDDIAVFGASATDLVLYSGADTNTDKIDSLIGFKAGTDKIQITDTVTFAGLTMASATTLFDNDINDGVANTPFAITAGKADIDALTAAFETAATGVASSASSMTMYTFTTADGTGAFDGKTYLVINDATAAIAATDVIIDITGVTGDITAADFQIA